MLPRERAFESEQTQASANALRGFKVFIMPYGLLILSLFESKTRLRQYKHIYDYKSTSVDRGAFSIHARCDRVGPGMAPLSREQA